MSDPLAVYLHDHMAGSVHAVGLIEGLRDRYVGEPLGEFASRLLIEVEADRVVLKQIAERVGDGSAKFKEAVGWVADQVSRFKLGHDKEGGLETFEALEFLTLGIHGKLALWRALDTVAPFDPRLGDVDFERLASRAEKQESEIEAQRLEIASRALVQSGRSRRA